MNLEKNLLLRVSSYFPYKTKLLEETLKPPTILNSNRLIKDLMLRNTFHKLSMVQIGKRRPSLEDISRCVQFSISARLPPRWNPVGHFLVRSQDFLEIVGDSASYQAVRLNIQTRGDHKMTYYNLPKHSKTGFTSFPHSTKSLFIS